MKKQSYFNEAWIESKHLTPYMNLATSLTLNGRYQQAINIFKELLESDDSTLEEYKIERSFLKSRYLVALQKSGQEVEFEEELKKRQSSFISRILEKQQIRKQMSGQEPTESTARSVNIRSSKRKEKTSFSKVNTINASYQYTETPGFIESPPTKAEIPEEKKPKIKMRGVADPSFQLEKNMKDEEGPSASLITIEDLLGKQGNAYKIFCKIFQSFANKTSAKHIKISLADIETMLNGLDQDYDSSKGKGSHTKITLDPPY